jgi:DNA-binding NarL/FixJ family response regulator
MSAEIRVAIADDHKIFRKGVILSLRHYPNIKFVLEAENGEDLLNNIQEANPQVVLMDLRMPIKDGIETTKYISKHYPNIAVLVLTMHEDDKFVTHLMENGANGYLLKSTDPQEIRKAITEVAAKGYYLNNFVNRILLKRSHIKSKQIGSLTNSIDVTSKEKDVLRYICMEFTSQEIGDKMNLSARTVESIKERLMERFGVKNTAGLVFFAVKNELVD